MRLAFLQKPVAALAALTLSACSLFAPYRIDVRQGNEIDNVMLAQLKPGMTREQVRFALGSPLVADAFHSERWDYVYRFTSGRWRDVQQRRVSIFFADNKLSRIEGDTDTGGVEDKSRNQVIEVPRIKD